MDALTDKLPQLTEVVSQMTQPRSSASGPSAGLRLPNIVLPHYRSTDDLDDFLHQLRSILETTETPSKHWVALLKQQVMQDKRAFDLVRLAESQFCEELTRAKSDEDYRAYYKHVQSFLCSKRGKPKEEKTLDLLTNFNSLSQNDNETVAEFAVRFLDLHHDLQKLIPNIYVVSTQEGDGSTKTDDLQLQLQFIVKLREEIRKEIVARQAKYESIQSLIEAARRFENFHLPPKGAPCQGQESESTVWCSALQCFNCGREGHFARNCRYRRKGSSRWPGEADMSQNGWDNNPPTRSDVSLRPAGGAWGSSGPARNGQGVPSEPKSFYDETSFDESQWFSRGDYPLRQNSKGFGKGRKGGKGKAKGQSKGYGYRQGTTRRGQVQRKRFRVHSMDAREGREDDESSLEETVHRGRKEESAQEKTREQPSRAEPKKDDYLAMPLYVNAGDIGQDISRRQILATLISPRYDLPGVRTLIDTCCSVSLVSKEHAEYLQRLGFKCGKVRPAIEVGMASEEATFKTEVVQEVPLCFDGDWDHSVRMECPVIDGLQWPLIIGINHLTLLNAHINCVDRVVQIEHGHWRTVLDCTESTSGAKSDLVSNTVDLIRSNYTKVLEPGMNEVSVCFSQKEVTLPDNPWVKDIGINSTGDYFMVEGPLDKSSIQLGCFNVLVVNTSTVPKKIKSYEPLGRVINGETRKVSDSLRAELRVEKERLDEAREEVFAEPDRDLPPTGSSAESSRARDDKTYAAEVLKAIRLEECEGLSPQQRVELGAIITKYCRAFHLAGDHPPIYCTPYAIPESQVQFVKSELDRMVAEGICRPSDSPWSSPILVVSKKDEHGEKVRPRLIKTLLSKLAGKSYFSKLDMYSGFWHIGVCKEHISKTSFTTPYGIFEYLRLPFGLISFARWIQMGMCALLPTWMTSS
ncbi:hypothetical protein FOZ63_029774 [Perkinsus olseni]|uniref:CCHC-type domain-containing protein n=1 Tax=Perkinsus olseni TaxID=32597 RepID=A0A7J6NLA1_PEROL|nr:hypothetical protein FOZ63_029774 [Perkinsus olseni]